jgi:hypothetical protein
MKMTTSQKVSLVIVFAVIVFLLMAAYGLLPGLIALAAIIGRGVLMMPAIAVVKRPKSKGPWERAN